MTEIKRLEKSIKSYTKQIKDKVDLAVWKNTKSTKTLKNDKEN